MKHLVHYFKDNYQAELITMPEPSLGIVVVIPCFNEPDIVSAVNALYACDKPFCSIEIIVVVNYGEQHSQEQKYNTINNFEEVKELSKNLSDKNFKILTILKPDIPVKYAGVGFARKTGMDEAAYRFKLLNNPHGLIVCFDADSACDTNYFTEIERHYCQNQGVLGSSLYYEHPLSGNEFSKEIYNGICRYELHLRYYNQALRYAGLPFGYHTVGSSMLCTASAYAKVGGMNRRKAGEDFYFLQKIIQLEKFTEINTTRVIPSPRVSDRVPFGTGRAMLKYMESSQTDLLTYRLEAFNCIATLVKNLSLLYRTAKTQQHNVLNGLHAYLLEYLNLHGISEVMDEINNNCADYNSFVKRFFKWFDAFRTLKFLNWSHEGNRWYKKTVEGEAAKLLSLLKYDAANLSVMELLKKYRQIERNI